MTSRRKQRKAKRESSGGGKLKQVLLDESFLLCASGKGCEAIKCEDEIEGGKLSALTALLLAHQDGVLLVVDEAGRVSRFYTSKLKQLTPSVRDVLLDWLDGRGQKKISRKPANSIPKLLRRAISKRVRLTLFCVSWRLPVTGKPPFGLSTPIFGVRLNTMTTSNRFVRRLRCSQFDKRRQRWL